jgi:hypothetical protein
MVKKMVQIVGKEDKELDDDLQLQLVMISWMTAISTFNLSTFSFHTSSIVSSSTFAFPFPFDFALTGLASLTFCITLVVQHDSALACDINGSSTGTLSLAGH